MRLTLFLIIAGVLMSAGRAPVSAEQNSAAAAAAIVERMASGDFASVHARFDATMRASLTEEALASVWAAAVAQFGSFQSQSPARVSRTGQYDVAIVPCRFQRGELDVQIALDSAGRIAGLYLLPPGSASGEAQPSQPPAPAPAAGEAREEQVTVGKGEWALPGTLTLPAGSGPFPAVVLVHGSGPQDRDSTVGACKPFRDLARSLAARGIAVLRYEKRTKQHAAKMAASAGSITVREETIDDALAAVALLKKHPSINPQRIFVAGHSLGGMLAPRIAALDADIAGIILMAANARPVPELILEQLAYIRSLGGPEAETAGQELERAMKAAERIARSSGDSPAKPEEWLLGVPDSYWLQLAKYDPLLTAKQLKQPMLILQGGRDYQVTEKDFNLWKGALEGKAGVTLKMYPRLNHIFVEGEGRSTPQEYTRPGVVSDEVAADIASWILRQQPARR